MLKAVVLILLASAFPSFGQDFPQEDDMETSRFALELFEARENETLGAAPSSSDVRSISPLALDMIVHFEGSVKKDGIHIPYNDSAGYCTIGYGRLLDKKLCKNADLRGMGGGISESQAVQLLQEDLVFARRAVSRALVYESGSAIDVGLDQFSALVSFVFNVGEGNFRNSTLLRRIKQDRNDLAAREFLRWIYANKKPWAGLIVRRECEQTLFRGALSPTPGGGFARSNCASLGIAGTEGEPIDIEIGETTP